MQEMQETPVGSRGWEDPLNEERATHASIPWTEGPGGLQFTELQCYFAKIVSRKSQVLLIEMPGTSILIKGCKP